LALLCVTRVASKRAYAEAGIGDPRTELGLTEVAMAAA
jgi:hypothetical protein